MPDHIFQAITGIFLAIIAIVGPIIAAKQARKASVTVAHVGVEAGAFQRAEGIYKNSLEHLEGVNGDLRLDLEAEKKEVARLTEENKELNTKLDNLRREFSALSAKLDRFMGGPIPNPHNP